MNSLDPQSSPSLSDSSSLSPASPPSAALPPIVLVHGFRGAPAGLSSIADQLRAAGFVVYTPAIPPFAGAAPLNEYAPATYANFLEHYLRSEQIAQPILIGHSMGTLVTAAMAHFHPELINSRLILMSPISTFSPKFFALISPLSGYLPRRFVDYATTKYLFAGDSTDKRKKFKSVMKITAECSNQNPPSRRQAAAVARFASRHSLGEYRRFKDKKILLLAGEHDTLIPKKATLELANSWSENEVIVKFLEGTGHLHNYEKPLETSKLILDFLQDGEGKALF